MTPQRLLFYVLLPLLIANVLMWGFYAHSWVGAMLWAVLAVSSIKIDRWAGELVL